MYHGLVRIPKKSEASPTELVMTSSDGLSSLNVARLLQRYAQLFARIDAQKALQYIYIIPLSADLPEPVGQEQLKFAHEAIKEIVLETRRYAELLGDIQVDGTKVVSLGSAPS